MTLGRSRPASTGTTAAASWLAVLAAAAALSACSESSAVGLRVGAERAAIQAVAAPAVQVAAEPLAAVPLAADPGADVQHRERVDAMLGNPVFLEAVTLQLARELRLPGSEDYFLEILREGEGAPRIRDVVQLVPRRVEELVATGEWRPQDLKEWKWLVLTGMREGHYALMPKSLELAAALGDSAALYISAGLRLQSDELLRDVIERGFRHEDPNNRAYTAAAICLSGHQDYIESVRALVDDEHPWVQANAAAGLIVLGDAEGIEAARSLISSPAATRSQQEISFLFEALERAAPEANAMAFIRSVLPELEGVDRVAASSILVLHGGETEVAELRAALADLDPFGLELHRSVRALSRTLSGADVGALLALFRRPNSQTVNLDLVVALAKSGFEGVEAMLQKAAFTLPWNQGLLAAGSAQEAFGGGVLFRWIKSAPDSTPPEVFRRMGWAAAAFGGAQAVQELRERAAHPELGLPADRRSLALQGAELALLEGASGGGR